MIKRMHAFLLAALCILLPLASAAAAGASDVLAGLPSSFVFMSGAGGWDTTVHIQADGSFTGLYQDSNMGDYGDDHPNGSLYQCRFSGTFSDVTQIDAYEYALRIATLITEQVEGEEQIVDGVKIVAAHPYGFDHADEFRLYLPGKDPASLPQAYIDSITPALAWEWENSAIPSPLTFHGLYNIGGAQGFFGSDAASWLNDAAPMAASAGPSASHVIGTVTVTAASAIRVRTAASEAGHPLVRINPGASYPCVGQTASGWYLVFCGDYIGYVPEGSVAFAAQGTQAGDDGPLRGIVQITSNDFANIRSTPGQNGEWLAGVSPGVTLDCIDIAANGWYCVLLPSGARGYVSNKLCTLQ